MLETFKLVNNDSVRLQEKETGQHSRSLNNNRKIHLDHIIVKSWLREVKRN